MTPGQDLMDNVVAFRRENRQDSELFNWAAHLVRCHAETAFPTYAEKQRLAKERKKAFDKACELTQLSRQYADQAAELFRRAHEINQQLGVL